MGASGFDSRRRALAVCLAAAFMSGLDVSIVNVALPSIREGLSASEDGLQWTLSGYALTFGLLLVPAGRLGDARSRRAIFMWGVALFTLSSAACGFAGNMTVLIVARLVQGMAAGMMNPQVSGLIQQMFRGSERGRAFGALGATIGVSTAAGPLIGGALVTAFGPEHGWRWVFLVNLPIGIALLPLARHVLPAPGAAGVRDLLGDGEQGAAGVRNLSGHREPATTPRRRESMDPTSPASPASSSPSPSTSRVASTTAH